MTFLSLPWQGRGGQVEGYPCVSALMSSSFPLSKREVIIMTHDNYCEGQVPDNCFGNSSNCGEIPFRGNPTPAPEWAAGYWAPVLSVTGWTPEPKECLTESILHVCCRQLGCSGSLYPALNDPTQEGGSWGIYRQLPSCVG